MNKSSSPLDFIDLDELQAIQDSFARTVNISSVIVYPDGKPMTRFTNPTSFCSLIQSTEKGKQCCFRSFMEMSKKALELKKPQIFNCFVNGGHFVSPIIINDEHKGTLFAGQFIPKSFSNEQLEEIEKIAVEINVDPVQLIEEAKHMRVIDKDLVWNNANLLFRIEKMITRLGMQAFELQKAHDQQEVLVQERTAELMKSNEELKQEIIERKRIEEALQEMAASLKNQRDELEIRSHEIMVANKTKSEFLANMSHELRTPLNSIIGFSHILHDETVGPLNEKQSKYVNNVLVSGNHLLELINGILDLVKVEAGKMELTCEDFNVCAVIEESVMLLSSVALKKNIILNTAVDEELTTINADMGKFRQILYNLMSNAIKFTPNGGSVTVEGRYNQNMAQIAVIDTGIGISKEDQDKLFNPFVQLDSSLSRIYEGTGLGLVLVKRFVEMHGGKIWIKSEPDRGSKFIFTIPIKSSLTLGVS